RVASYDEASLGEDAFKQGRIFDDIDVDEGITLVDETAENQGRFNDQEDIEMLFDVADDLRGEEVFVSQKVPLKEVNDATKKLQMLQLMISLWLKLLWKLGKAIMIEEPVKLKKKDQIMLDEEVALKLQAELQVEFDKEQRLAREKAKQIKEVNIDWMIFKQRLISKEAKAEVTKGSSKRAEEELEQENAKKKKMKDDKESTKLKKCLEILLEDGDDVTIDATHLSFKSPTIVDYKIHKKGKKSYFQIFRADGNSQMYLTFSKMLKIFDREDLEVHWRLVKANLRR
nr:hypothetical protein [Tanacetum cinerariifolium]